MKQKKMAALVLGILIAAVGCAQNQDYDGHMHSPASTDSNADRSMPASASHAPGTGLGRMGENGQNEAGGSFEGIH